MQTLARATNIGNRVSENERLLGFEKASPIIPSQPQTVEELRKNRRRLALGPEQSGGVADRLAVPKLGQNRRAQSFSGNGHMADEVFKYSDKVHRRFWIAVVLDC